jgi:hypothetical protein
VAGRSNGPERGDRAVIDVTGAGAHATSGASAPGQASAQRLADWSARVLNAAI